MSKRLEVFKFAPAAYKGLSAVKEYVSSALPAELLELVNLRVSQINGCAFCIDMHTRDLLKQGVKIDKIALLPVWDEAAALFSAKEQAALAWAETVTRVEQTKVPDADYQKALAVLGEQELADLTVAVALMNAFNRFGVSMRMQPAALAA
ncbi:carboxymuconolactone decarboxylase family protein [Pseudoduganella sp. FT55W]|uniref:Carboxymuconolactone decarboxylase family protein n=1 Tax=Duganella rivi TaxID=2666083 RepID=A0A7X4KDK7_9BURK|nr:carboxymuconolactone decarboxylase family protein [Duganella rivi]MYM69340.1 carboxymuconolactone decarboxylase family protein [Duganella rivi]